MEPTCILDRKEITLWNQVIGQVKVQWMHQDLDESTWELKRICEKNTNFCLSKFCSPRTVLF